jgi:iron(III) transport system ATP-binding protein
MAAQSVPGPVELSVTGVEHTYGEGPVLRSVDAHAAAGSTLVLLGPSGCGKTTLLRVIAGLERPTAGEVRLGDRVVAGPSQFVPAERRRVGMVFQDGALFPHLTVARNVGFGLGRSGDAAGRVERALELVGLADLGHRMPAELSGGQRQRVAVARALAPEPTVLLLDEPFASLDAAMRVELRGQIHRLLHELEITAVFVTHDQDEAFVLGDQVAVMRGGRVLQAATPADLYAHPADPWVAGFVGDANLVSGDLDGSSAHTPIGSVPIVGADRSGPVLVLVRPEHLTLRPGGDAVVQVVEFYRHDTVYVVRIGDTELNVRVGAAPAYDLGDRVTVTYSGPATTAYPHPVSVS